MSPRIETISEVTLYPDKAGWGRLLEGLLGLAKHHKGGASENPRNPKNRLRHRIGGNPGCRVRAGVEGSEGTRKRRSFSLSLLGGNVGGLVFLCFFLLPITF